MGPETVSRDQSALSYSLKKWTHFTLLLLIAPALPILIQAFTFVAAIFFAAGILYPPQSGR